MKTPPLPRRIAFAGDARIAVALSPDGARLAWLTANDARRLSIASAEQPTSAHSVGPEGVSPVLFWAGDGHVLLFRDGDGDENWQALSVDVKTGSAQTITPPGARALFLRAAGGEALFALNDRDATVADLVAVGLVSGAMRRVHTNVGGFSRVHADGTLTPQLAERVRDDGSVEFLRPQGAGWVPCAYAEPDAALSTRVVGLEGGTAWLIDSRGRNRAALTALDIATGATEVLAEDPDADIDRVVLLPSGEPVLVAATAARRRWWAVRPSLGTALAALGSGEVDVLSVSRGAKRLHARIEQSNTAANHKVLDSAGATVGQVRARDDLEGVVLAPMEVVEVQARDGLRLVGYLTRARGVRKRAPMVLAVHGGPYDRDEWGFSPTHQWLASRGYVVLSINFRGSTGFGKAFVAAADGEWGARMQDDLVDAVAWAVGQGVADPERVGVFGASYGGYAALMAGALAPEVFACVAAINAPASLAQFMVAIPPYWRPWFATIRRRLADPETAVGRVLLDARSPLSNVRRMSRPVLLVQGAHDVRVQAQQARIMAAALAKARVPATLAVFPDEGHFINHAANRVGLAALAEAFFAYHLRGTLEPVEVDLTASSVVLEAGGEFLPKGMTAALASRAQAG
jgi:dipeptidyl aminopeptidase/acylaminoacyl peptidase